MHRPDRLIVIAGTGTEVGKTWAGVKVLELAKQSGLRVAARKPAQSFNASDATTDADLLATASAEQPLEVCPRHRWYAIPMAPPMAAEVLNGQAIRIDDLLAEIIWPASVQLGLVETAGGLRSPIAHDADNVDLIRRLAPDAVLLVADAGLGTLNSVRLSLDALTGYSAQVLLNRFDPVNGLHRRNHDWLRERYSVDVFTTVETWWSDFHEPV
jgi:dethiobiotin synthetase